MLTRLDRLVAALLLGALLLAAVALGERAQTLSGPPRVVDGDTIELGGERLRLLGFDAPELAQICRRGGAPYRCGDVARTALVDLIGSGPVTCRVSGRDKYDRGLAVCEAGGVDLGRALVSRGLAVAYGGYTAEEREARRLGLGLWAGSFEQPSTWRRGHRLARGEGAEKAGTADEAHGRTP